MAMIIIYDIHCHFLYQNALRLYCSPFPNVDDMNGTLIQYWNQLMKKDFIYILENLTMK